MATAFVWADRSTCPRLHVGAVIHREGRILVQGYNGAPSGLPHCRHESWYYDEQDPQTMSFEMAEALKEATVNWEGSTMGPGTKIFWDGSTFTMGYDIEAPGCTQAVHAEANAIAFAARSGVELKGADLVVTHQPCLSCAMLIINSGIKLVTYVHPYRLADGVNLLGEAGITVEQYLDWEEPRLVVWGDDAPN